MPPTNSIRWRLAWMAVVAAFYVLGGWLGLRAAMVDANVITLAWPPTGIAIAALLRGGLGLWPGVALGAFLINWWSGLSISVAVGIAIGNTLGPVLTALALRRLGLKLTLDRRRDVGWFCLAVAVGLTIPPTMGVSCLALGGLMDWNASSWLLWWLGDVVGALVVAPLILTSQRQVMRRFTDRFRAVEFVLLCSATMVVGALIFFGTRQLPLAFLILPLVLWSALRFGSWGSSLTVVLIAVLAVAGTANHSGPFAPSGLASVLLLTAFLATTALLNLLLGSLLAERARAEIALINGLERMRQALDHAHMVTCEVDLRLGQLCWGVKADTLFGAEPGAVPMTMNDFFARVHPNDQAHLQAAMAQGLKGIDPRYEVEYRVLRLDGTLRWVASVGEFLRDESGNVVRTAGVSHDITDRRQAEQALRESELRNRTLIEHSPEAIVVFDVDQGRFCDANSRACQLFALELPHLLASNPIALNPPHQPDGQSSAAGAQAMIDRAIAGEVPRFEWVHRDAHGNDFPCEIWLMRLPSAGRTLVRGTMIDISERKKAQAALSASEERLRIAFAAAGLGAWETDPASGHMTWTPDCCRLHGIPATQAPQTVAEFILLVPTDHRAALRKAFARTVVDGTPLQCEYHVIGSDGNERWFVTYARCLSDAQGRPQRVIGVAMDVSARHQADEARQRLEAHLFQAQKMEAIGTLAGGIAHDFNNILAAIIGNLELARGDVVTGHPVQQRLDQILAASLRARNLVRQILAFSRQQGNARSVLQLEPLVHEVTTLLRASLPATVTLDIRIEPDCPPVRADASQMHQILMNLCTNAWQALPAQRGRLLITLAPIDIDGDRALSLPGLSPGSHLRLSVSDTGTGMDAQTQARIFEPFFTTKPTGQGTGLGLAVVHGIVQAHDGSVVVASQVGFGSVFHVYLPATTATAPSTLTRPAVPPRGHGEHILLVDDEPSLVALSQDMLSDLGYRVSSFTSAAAALAAYRADPTDIDLVVSDLTMPEMSGLELARALLDLRPDLPIIIATGYSGALSQDEIQAAGIRALLIKPALHVTLAAAVFEHLRQLR